MSLLILLLAPGIFAIYWIIRMQICLSRIRYLVDTYGLSRNKLRALQCKEVKKLRENIDQLRTHNDTDGLESLIRPYRA
ncbi:hypothetical protein [Polynucleobacter sp.]|uniref:hypothetical protein n=1 Tax=Polynucleobacter sp. TaxID=2029855 RepID=UPI0033405ACD